MLRQPERRHKTLCLVSCLREMFEVYCLSMVQERNAQVRLPFQQQSTVTAKPQFVHLKLETERGVQRWSEFSLHCVPACSRKGKTCTGWTSNNVGMTAFLHTTRPSILGQAGCLSLSETFSLKQLNRSGCEFPLFVVEYSCPSFKSLQ